MRTASYPPAQPASDLPALRGAHVLVQHFPRVRKPSLPSTRAALQRRGCARAVRSVSLTSLINLCPRRRTRTDTYAAWPPGAGPRCDMHRAPPGFYSHATSCPYRPLPNAGFMSYACERQAYRRPGPRYRAVLCWRPSWTCAPFAYILANEGGMTTPWLIECCIAGTNCKVHLPRADSSTVPTSSILA